MKYSAPMNHMSGDAVQAYSKTGRLGAILGEIVVTSCGVEALEKLATTRSPLETHGAHAKRVAAAAKKLQDGILKSERKIAEAAEAINHQLQAEINTATRLTPTAAAAEIRSVFRGMDSTARLKQLSKAVKNGDTATLAALAEGNEITTGMDDTLKSNFIRSYQEQVCPELFETQQALTKLLETAPTVLNMGKKAVSDAFDPGFIEELEAAELKAVQAQQNFDKALGA